MNEIEYFRNLVEELTKTYSKCFNVYVTTLLMGMTVIGILGIWVLYSNTRDKYLR